jgi:hypothetical protein
MVGFFVFVKVVVPKGFTLDALSMILPSGPLYFIKKVSLSLFFREQKDDILFCKVLHINNVLF